MDLEAIRDLFNALYRDFKKLSSSDPDYDRRYRYMLITNYLAVSYTHLTLPTTERV